MNKIFLFFTCIFSFVKIYSQENKSTIEILYHTDQIPLSSKIELARVVELYHQKYGLTYDTLHIYTQAMNEEKKSNGAISITEAYSEYQKITFNDLLVKGWNVKAFSNILKHELFHTLVKESISMKPFWLQDNDSICGCNGFSFRVKLKNNATTYLTQLDEAAAEVCAIRLGEGYSQENHYYSITRILNYLIELKYISENDLSYFASHSDIHGLIEKILNVHTVTDNQLISFYNLFESVRYHTDECASNESILQICLKRNKSVWIKN